MEINLYTTAGCHLCEQALALLEDAARHGHDITVCLVEIAESESLMAQYGVRIPVIQPRGSDEELGWPFTYEELESFLANP